MNIGYLRSSDCYEINLEIKLMHKIKGYRTKTRNTLSSYDDDTPSRSQPSLHPLRSPSLLRPPSSRHLLISYSVLFHYIFCTMYTDLRDGIDLLPFFLLSLSLSLNLALRACLGPSFLVSAYKHSNVRCSTVDKKQASKTNNQIKSNCKLE